MLTFWEEEKSSLSNFIVFNVGNKKTYNRGLKNYMLYTKYDNEQKKGVKRERKLSFSIFHIPLFACSCLFWIVSAENEKQTMNDGNVFKID